MASAKVATKKASKSMPSKKEEGTVWVSPDGILYTEPKIDADLLKKSRENKYIVEGLGKQRRLIFRKGLKVELIDRDNDDKVDEKESKFLMTMVRKPEVALHNKIQLLWEDAMEFGCGPYNDAWTDTDEGYVLTKLNRLPPETFENCGSSMALVYNRILQGIRWNHETKETEYWQTQADGSIVQLKNVGLIVDPLCGEIGGTPYIIPLVPFVNMLRFLWNKKMQEANIYGAGGLYFIKVKNPQGDDTEFAQKILNNESGDVRFQLRENMDLVVITVSGTGVAIEGIQEAQSQVQTFFTASNLIQKDGTLIGGSSQPEFDLFMAYLESTHRWLEEAVRVILLPYLKGNGFASNWDIKVTIPDLEYDKSNVLLSAVSSAFSTKSITLAERRKVYEKVGIETKDMTPEEEKALLAEYEANNPAPVMSPMLQKVEAMAKVISATPLDPHAFIHQGKMEEAIDALDGVDGRGDKKGRPFLQRQMTSASQQSKPHLHGGPGSGRYPAGSGNNETSNNFVGLDVIEPWEDNNGYVPTDEYKEYISKNGVSEPSRELVEQALSAHAGWDAQQKHGDEKIAEYWNVEGEEGKMLRASAELEEKASRVVENSKQDNTSKEISKLEKLSPENIDLKNDSRVIDGRFAVGYDPRHEPEEYKQAWADKHEELVSKSKEPLMIYRKTSSDDASKDVLSFTLNKEGAVANPITGGDQKFTPNVAWSLDDVKKNGYRIISGFARQRGRSGEAEVLLIKDKQPFEHGGAGSGRYPKGSGNVKGPSSSKPLSMKSMNMDQNTQPHSTLEKQSREIIKSMPPKEEWANPRGREIAELAAMAHGTGMTTDVATNDSDGFEGIIAHYNDADGVNITYLASVGKTKGVGSDLLKKVIEANPNKDINLFADPGAVTYYQHIGMEQLSGDEEKGGVFRWAAKDAKAFADKGTEKINKILDDVFEHGGPGSGRYPAGSGDNEESSSEPMSVLDKLSMSHQTPDKWTTNDVDKIKPTITTGEAFMCWENAQKEFEARSKSGQESKIVFGKLATINEDNEVLSLDHVWVEDNDGKIYDATPQTSDFDKIGSKMDERLPAKVATKSLYVKMLENSDYSEIAPLKKDIPDFDQWVDSFSRAPHTAHLHSFVHGGPGSGRYPKGSGNSSSEESSVSSVKSIAPKVTEDEQNLIVYGSDSQEFARKVEGQESFNEIYDYGKTVVDSNEGFRSYQGGGYHEINDYLRHPEKYVEVDGVTRDIVAGQAGLMDEAFVDAPEIPEGTVMWRGVGSETGERIAAMKVGDICSDQGFQSHTIAPEVANRFSKGWFEEGWADHPIEPGGPQVHNTIIRAISGKGVKGIYGGLVGEFEVVVNRGTRWKVVGKEEVDLKTSNWKQKTRFHIITVVPSS